MKRISKKEYSYAFEALDNEFSTSKNSIFNNKLEQKFSEIFDVRFAIGHVNGTATMHTALYACGVRPGDEVIVPPLTMSSTSLAVLHNGSTPVFADVDKKTFNISPESIAKVITEKTKAVITVSLYGLAPDYEKILEICNKHNLFLIEDNAECFLGKYQGKIVGHFGHFSSYSFQASKHITCGEGGMLITNEQELADKARKFSSLGYAGVSAKQGKITREDIQSPLYSRHISLGFNYRMSEIQAAVALGQLERAEELVDNRVKVAKIFDEVISAQSLLVKQFVPPEYINTYWSYSVILNTDDPNREWFDFRNIFKKNGGDGYYAAWKLTYNEPYFINEVQKMPAVWQNYSGSLCPNSEYLQPRMIQLKTNYWNLEEANIQADILDKSIREFLG